jgi:hypothetical protein
MYFLAAFLDVSVNTNKHFPDCLSVRMLWTVSLCGSRTFCEGASTPSQCSPNRCRLRRGHPDAHSEPRRPLPAATLASLKLTRGRWRGGGGRNRVGSVAECRSGMFIPDPNYLHPGCEFFSIPESGSATNNFSILTQKTVSKDSGSRGQKCTGSRIPDHRNGECLITQAEVNG